METVIGAILILSAASVFTFVFLGERKPQDIHYQIIGIKPGDVKIPGVVPTEAFLTWLANAGRADLINEFQLAVLEYKTAHPGVEIYVKFNLMP